MACVRACFSLAILCFFSAYRNAASKTTTLKPSPYVWFVHGHPANITCTVTDWREGDATPVWNWVDEGDDERPVDPPKHTITNTQDVEAGTYTSTFSIAKDERFSDSSNLMCVVHGVDTSAVTVRWIEVEHPDVNVSVGFETTLHCNPETRFETLAVQWMKDGLPITEVPSLAGRLKIGDGNKSIAFQDTKVSDTGVYTCWVRFYPGSPFEQSFEMTVHALGKPFINSTEGPDSLTTVTNTSATLLCPAAGQPPPEVIWFRGDDVIQSDDHVTLSAVDGVESAKLHIQDWGPDDVGTYTCSAESTFGKTSLTFEIPDPQGNHGRSLAVLVAALGASLLVSVGSLMV